MFKRTTHVQHALGEVNVAPLRAEQFAPPAAGRGRKHDQCRKPRPTSSRKEAIELVNRECALLTFERFRLVRLRGDVLLQDPFAFRLPENAMDQAMMVRNRLLMQTGFPPCGIRAIEMAGGRASAMESRRASESRDCA